MQYFNFSGIGEGVGIANDETLGVDVSSRRVLDSPERHGRPDAAERAWAERPEVTEATKYRMSQPSWAYLAESRYEVCPRSWPRIWYRSERHIRGSTTNLPLVH